MKKILIPALAAFMAVPAFAYSDREVDADYLGLQPYIAIRGGATYMTLKYNMAGEKQTVDDTVFQGRAALGMSFFRGGRSEVEATLYTKAKETKDFVIGDVDVGFSMQNILLNTYIDIGRYNLVQPFVGVGAGIAMTKITRDGSALGVGVDLGDQKDTKFTAMGAVGLSFALEHFALDVAARYNYVDIQSGMHTVGADVGIRIMF